MANELAKMMKNKRDAELRLQNQNQKPVVIENTDGSYYAPEQSDYTAQLAQGKNITITTSGNIKTIAAVMNLLEGSNISVTAPDENGAVTITGTIGGKEIDLTGLTDGYVLTYDGVNDKFIVSEVSSSYTLPQATETVLGGIKAKAKTTESSEVAIDTVTGKLYGPSPDAATNGLPSGGTAGQLLSKIDGTDYHAGWTDPTSGGGGLWDIISETVLASDASSISIPDLSAYNFIKVSFYGIIQGAAFRLVARYNGDTGNNYYLNEITSDSDFTQAWHTLHHSDGVSGTPIMFSLYVCKPSSSIAGYSKPDNVIYVDSNPYISQKFLSCRWNNTTSKIASISIFDRYGTSVIKAGAIIKVEGMV